MASGKPMTTTSKDCIRKEDLARMIPNANKDQSCKVTLVSSSGTKQELKMDCASNLGKQTGTIVVEALSPESTRSGRQPGRPRDEHDRQRNVADLKNRAGQIEQRFGVNSVVIPPLGSPAGGSAAGHSAAPSSPVAQPSAAGASAIPTPQAPRPVPTVNAPPQQRPDYCGSGGRRASGEDREPGAGECLRAEERHHARRCASGIQGRSLHGPIGGRHPHTRRVHGGGGQPRAVRWRSESRFVHGVPSGAR